eukprot:GHVO01020297.1.p1 GENE.GHVO01020297.1~~GHVO01020297.1.p1  ORF type:complete len:464 (+),score=83.51 GHVO01020297.1:35-1426(+)
MDFCDTQNEMYHGILTRYLIECNTKQLLNEKQITKFENEFIDFYQTNYGQKAGPQPKSWLHVSSMHGIKTIKTWTENNKIYDKHRLVTYVPTSNVYAVPIYGDASLEISVPNSINELLSPPQGIHPCAVIRDYIHTTPPTEDANNTHRSPPKSQLIRDAAKKQAHPPYFPITSTHFSKWEKFGTVAIFNWDVIPEELLSHDCPSFWDTVLGILNVKTIGINMGPISNEKRQPLIRILHGASGYTYHREGGVTYAFDVTKNMFSSGNGTARARISDEVLATPVSPSRQYTVVDMFCGIGYFTLPILAKNPNVMVYAIDINQDATDALSHNIDINDINRDRVRIMNGDSRYLGSTEGPDGGVLKGVADRIVLGLIPSSELAWEAASHVMSPGGCIIHVHGLEDTCSLKLHANDQPFAQYVKARFSDMLRERAVEVTCEVIKVEKVKNYSPGRLHVVVDICMSHRE